MSPRPGQEHMSLACVSWKLGVGDGLDHSMAVLVCSFPLSTWCRPLSETDCWASRAIGLTVPMSLSVLIRVSIAAPPPPPPLMRNGGRDAPPPPPPYRMHGSSEPLSRGKPPPPPTRTPAGPPPPPPPVRNGHRDSIATVRSFLDDFESKYSFHPVEDFPAPEEYKHFQRTYPSKTNRATRGAPPLPPIPR
uniref:WAS/WASL interacting protein family member 2 n=1 Tax=Chrysemys picta bellii TaxID=8478 RepID=A0A8C3FCC8_CHRPI